MSENDRYGLYEAVPAGFNLLEAPPASSISMAFRKNRMSSRSRACSQFWKKLVSPPFSASAADVRAARSVHPWDSVRTSNRCLNWSGAVISPPWPKRIILAVAGWIAPKVSHAVRAGTFHARGRIQNRWYGWASTATMAGCRKFRFLKSALPPATARSEPQHFAWWDWWHHSPDGAEDRSRRLGELRQFRPGDEILAGLRFMISGDVLFFIKNQSTGEFRSFLAKPPPLGDIEPLGSSVEWVVERPTEPDQPAICIRFRPMDPVDFRYCVALGCRWTDRARAHDDARGQRAHDRDARGFRKSLSYRLCVTCGAAAGSGRLDRRHLHFPGSHDVSECSAFQAGSRGSGQVVIRPITGVKRPATQRLYSSLMFAASITFFHRAVSEAM